MKLPKPKYSVPSIDYLHFLIQTAVGFAVGYTVYSLIYALIQQLEHNAYMNDADAKEYVMSTGVKVLVVVMNILFTHIFPIVFQSLFLRQKANDQYEDSDNKLMWLSKGLRFMLPVAIPYAVIIGLVTCMNFEYVYLLFMPALNLMQVLTLLFRDFMYFLAGLVTLNGVPVIPTMLCCIVYMAVHITLLMLVYRYFWQKWSREKDIGRVTMSADAYMSHPESGRQ